MLADLDVELNASGIHLAFAELQTAVRDTIVRYGLLETIDEGHLYRSVSEAVEAYRLEIGTERSTARQSDGLGSDARPRSGR